MPMIFFHAKKKEEEVKMKNEEWFLSLGGRCALLLTSNSYVKDCERRKVKNDHFDNTLCEVELCYFSS